jgi:microcompartment protein CcmL/EutN
MTLSDNERTLLRALTLLAQDTAGNAETTEALRGKVAQMEAAMTEGIQEINKLLEALERSATRASIQDKEIDRLTVALNGSDEHIALLLEEIRSLKQGALKLTIQRNNALANLNTALSETERLKAAQEEEFKS